MALRKVYSDTDVLTAAKQRIKNVFSGNKRICLSFSAGKDSLVMSHIVWSMIRDGEIDGSKLVVTFIDEEGLYPSMVQNALNWKMNFESVGVEFRWYCMPFKQVCTIDHLSADESWITWEPGKEDVWMRDMPSFAIKSHPALHYAGEMNYQTFFAKVYGDYCSLVGLRAPESVQRMRTVASIDVTKAHKRFYPIYDWRDDDVWLYIKKNDLDFPEIYMHLYEAGVRKKDLRLCAFFGDSTTQGLRWIAETDPALWERIQRREPNAYLVMLYWDSEMFGRNGAKRKELESDSEEKDYRAILMDMLFTNPDNYYIASDTRKKIKEWQKTVVSFYGFMTEKHFKRAHDALVFGDPKGRTLRALISDIVCDYANKIDKEIKENGRI